MTKPSPTSESATTDTSLVMVYSDDRTTREEIRLSLGRRPAADLPEVEVVEVATEPAVWREVESRAFDLLILDGEATPAGGMGIGRQIKDEILDPPPVMVVIGRPTDAWLATWSRAEGVVAHPIDPLALATTAADLIRTRRAAG